MVHWSIHTFAIQVDELRVAAKRLQDDFEVTIANFGACVWAGGGDWEFLADGEGSFVPDSAGSGFCYPVGDVELRAGQRCWSKAIGRYVDLSTAEPIHWCIATGRFARVDRIFVNSPEAVLISGSSESRLLSDPCKLMRSWDSFHLPVQASTG